MYSEEGGGVGGHLPTGVYDRQGEDSEYMDFLRFELFIKSNVFSVHISVFTVHHE